MQATPIRIAARGWEELGFRPDRLGTHEVQQAGAARSRPGSTGWTDVGSILVLLVIALSLRLYLVWHTQVAPPGSIGFIGYAGQLGQRPWVGVLRETEQPPLYALAVLAMSSPVRHAIEAPESVVMQRSAQITSALAGTLLVIPMFLLGKEL